MEQSPRSFRRGLRGLTSYLVGLLAVLVSLYLALVVASPDRILLPAPGGHIESRRAGQSGFGLVASRSRTSNRLPNIVYILADDLGLGDVRSYTANSPVRTPGIDRIASAGMLFTNGHSPSAVCSPTRYGILTGEYAWRTKGGLVRRYEPALIASGTRTVASLLNENGYRTAAFGKWHLGLNWQTTDGQPVESNGENVDLSLPFSGGPVDHGFDTYFGDDVINLPPLTWIEDKRALNISYDPVGVMPTITARAVDFIDAQAQTAEPFFLYMAFTAPHLPILPPDFITEGETDYERFIATVDWSVGQMLDALERQHIDHHTMVVFASDNGVAKRITTSPDISPGFVDGTPLRGGKGDIFEGGHRIPLLVRWDPHVAPGSVSNQYVELNDFYATVADILGVALSDGEATDSRSMLSALKGNTVRQIRRVGINHSQWGVFAIRQFDTEDVEWKLVLGDGSGGMTTQPHGDPFELFSDIGNRFHRLQLYNLTADVGETMNLVDKGGTEEMRTRALELQSLLREYTIYGRSTPSPSTKGAKTDRPRRSQGGGFS